MKEHFVTILTTLAIFLVGLFTGVWTQNIKPLPPPHIPFMGEFGDFHGGPQGDRMREMHEAMVASEPEILAFEGKVNVIVDEYRGKIKAILTKDQLPKMDQFVFEPPNIVSRAGETHGPMGPPMAGPLRFVGMMIYTPTLTAMPDELPLDEGQKAKVESLLRERREKILALVDTTPLPSIMADHKAFRQPMDADKGKP